jgi:hypothetical protein
MASVMCGKVKCLLESEIAEAIDEVFADDNSGDELETENYRRYFRN